MPEIKLKKCPANLVYPNEHIYNMWHFQVLVVPICSKLDSAPVTITISRAERVV
jgi:hypothetical protein